MQDPIEQIATWIDKREIKRAEGAIARLLRTRHQRDEQQRLLTFRARTRLMAGRPDDALDDLHKVSALRPQSDHDPVYLTLLADCTFARFELSTVGFSERGDAYRARQIYQHLLRDYPDYDDVGWVHYQLGRVYLVTNHSREAEDHLLQALFAPSPQRTLTAYVYERLAFIAHYEARQPQQALTYIDKAIQTYPDRADAPWLVQAMLLRVRILRGLNPHQALSGVREALHMLAQRLPEDRATTSEALFLAAELLAEQPDQAQEVIEHLQQFVQINKTPLGVDVSWSRAHEMLGDAYFTLRQYDEAASAYRLSLQYNPYHPWEESIRYRIARCYYLISDYQKTVEAIQTILDNAAAEGQRVSDYRVYNVLANAELALKRYERAREAYQMALDLIPPNVDRRDLESYYEFARLQS